MSSDKDCGGNKGFFSGLFGGTPKDTCISCGNATKDCDCNSALKDHLKKCYGFGTLPKLIQKCEDAPGYRDPKTITTSSCNVGSGGSGGSCGTPPPQAQAACPEEPKKDSELPKQEECSGGGAKIKCPPMPETDCTKCKPAWFTCKSNFMKTYVAPDGDRILPLSTGGRMGGGCGESDTQTQSKCSCGAEKGSGSGSSAAKPKISASCPMNKPTTCIGAPAPEKSEGFFAKILAFFGFKENTDETSHRDVFAPSLVIRADGYMCPLVESVECAVGPCTCGEENPAEVVVEEPAAEEVQVEEICEEEVEIEEVEVEEECEYEEVEVEEVEEECEYEEVEVEVEETLVDEYETEALCLEEDVPPPPQPEIDCCACCDALRAKAVVEEEKPEEDVVEECKEEDLEPVPEFDPKETTNCKPMPDSICCGTDENNNCCPTARFVQRAKDPFNDCQREGWESIFKDICTVKLPLYEEPEELPPVVEEPCNDAPPETPPKEEDIPPALEDELILVANLPEVVEDCTPPAEVPPVVEDCPPVVETPPVVEPIEDCPPAAEITPVVNECPPIEPPPPRTCCGPSVCYRNCCNEDKKTAPKTDNGGWQYEPTPLDFCPAPASQQCPVRPPPPPPQSQCGCNTPPPPIQDCPAPPPPPTDCHVIPPLKTTCPPRPPKETCPPEPVKISPEPKIKKCSRPAVKFEEKECTPPPPPIQDNAAPPPVQDNAAPPPVQDYAAPPPPPPPTDCHVIPELKTTCPPPPCLPEPVSISSESTVKESPSPAENFEEKEITPPPPSCPCCEAQAKVAEYSEQAQERIDGFEEVNGSDDPIAKLVCGCSACTDMRGCSREEMFISETKPVPLGSCPYCGAKTRGDTEGCTLCQITRSMRDPYYIPPVILCEAEEEEKKKEAEKEPYVDRCYSDAFDMKEDGTAKYEGGMCLTRAARFLTKTNPRDNPLDTIAIDCWKDPDESFDPCKNKEKYQGGMSLSSAKEYIWKSTGGK